MPLDDLSSGPLEYSSFVRISNTPNGDEEPSWPNGEKEEIIESNGNGDDQSLNGFDTIDTS